MVALLKAPPQMTLADFLSWEPEDGRAWQLVDGEAIELAPTTRTHGALQSEMARLLGNHLRAQGGRCSVIVTPGVVPAMMSRINCRVPDLAVTCTPYVDEEAVLSHPVVIVEILSPGNSNETWRNVWAYATIPSVQEILVLRSDAISAFLLRRAATSSPGGGWPDEPEMLTEGDVTLASLGFSTDLASLYVGTRLARA